MLRFEKLNEATGRWETIAPDLLKQEIATAYAEPEQIIDLMIEQGAVARTSTAKYRRTRHQESFRDWAKILDQKIEELRRTE